MKIYDYQLNIFADVLNEIKETYSQKDIEEKLSDRFDFKEELEEMFWISDAVTGNGSGSYTCDSEKAKEYLIGNGEILIEALTEFGYNDLNILKKGAEWLDVTIRCYLLRSAICKALDYLEEKLCITK